ncbi:MAG: type II secretion system F family protein [Verrucomicrobiota bacterium]
MSFIVTPGKLTQRAELYHQLGSMLSAGIPLIQAVDMAGKNLPNRASRNALSKIGRNLQDGHTFAQSMSQLSGGWMTSFDLALLSAGEQSGRLDVVFKTLSGYYNSRAKITRDTISEMLQSLVTIHVFLLIFPLAYLIDAVTKGAVGAFIMQKFIVFGTLYGSVILLLYACQGQRGEKWRAVLEALSRRIPFLGKARHYLALARLSAALESLINAGISIINAWELSAIASGSVFIHRVVATWRPKIEGGIPPSELVNSSKQFPEMFANLYQTGETSGQQDDTLKRLHAYYEEEGFRKLRLFTKMLNGLIYAIVVIMVVKVVFGFYLGYFGAISEATNF